MPISIEADPTLAQGYIKVNGTTAATISTAGIVSGGVPAGAVMPFAMNSAPSGWLAADGTEYLKTGTYAALFAAIGTTHGETNGSGGAGTSHFRVPNLRGIFVRGSGDQTISGTPYSKAFALKEGDALQGHYHEFNYSSGIRGTAGAANNVDILDASPSLALSNRVGALITNGTNGTPRTASETRPANIALLYCIKH